MAAEDKRRPGRDAAGEQENAADRKGRQMDDGSVRSGHELPDTGQGQGQSKGKPQVQPQE